jgi:hypothetical protein
MAIQLPPIPNNPVTDTHVWRDWFFKVSQILVQGAAIAWTSLSFTGSNLRDIVTRQHNALQDIQGGDGADQYYHLTAAQYNSVDTLPTFGTIVTQDLGLTATITTAKLTAVGVNGSMTFVNGILTAQTQAT